MAYRNAQLRLASRDRAKKGFSIAGLNKNTTQHISQKTQQQ